MDRLLVSLGHSIVPEFKIMPTTQELQMRIVNCIIFLIFGMTVCGFVMGTLISCHSSESKDMTAINSICWLKQSVEITRNVSELKNITKMSFNSEDFRFTDQGLKTVHELIHSKKVSMPVYKTCEHVLFIALAVIVSYSMPYFIASTFDKKDLTDLTKGKLFNCQKKCAWWLDLLIQQPL